MTRSLPRKSEKSVRIPTRTSNGPRASGRTTSGNRGNIHPPRVASPECIPPPAGGHGPLGPWPMGLLSKGWPMAPMAPSDFLGPAGGREPAASRPSLGAQGPMAPPQPHSVSFTSRFTSIFTDVTSKFTDVLGLDCM